MIDRTARSHAPPDSAAPARASRSAHTPPHGGSGVAAGLIVAGVLLACLWAGCSIEKHYATLSFFFDGVPDPAAKDRVAEAGGITAAIRNSPTYSYHKPYAEEKCTECHTDRFQLTGQDSSLCLKCHADRTTEHPRMHGPVAAVACLWCHTPHESAQPHLLKKPARDVCIQCHEQNMLSTQRVPAHADAARSCLECHFGHGGTSQFFLRDGASAAKPRPQPSVPPSPATPLDAAPATPSTPPK